MRDSYIVAPAMNVKGVKQVSPGVPEDVPIYEPIKVINPSLSIPALGSFAPPTKRIKVVMKIHAKLLIANQVGDSQRTVVDG
jgi:hypothetical protein